MELTIREDEARALRRQARVGRLLFPLYAPLAIAYMRFVRGHRLVGVERLRRVYREAAATGRPVLVCSNHLTLTDSFFLLHALDTFAGYLLHFERFAWNVPAVENFFQTRARRAFMYVGKAIAIDRAGSAEHQRQVLAKLAHLVAHGQPVILFPEGGRSRSGRIEPENVHYGVGRVLVELADPIVVCVYMRGERQESWSDFPARGDLLHVNGQLLEPRTADKGLRAARDLSRQVIATLKIMEDRWFAARGTAPDV